MKDDHSPSRPLAVPSGRLLRVARLGTMSAGIAGNIATNALGEISRGARPDMRRLMLTPGNMRRVADQLRTMRGAAMKLGQLISLDTGEFLPPELAAILASVRDQAHFMPPKQLKQVLIRNWGHDWIKSFQRFDVRPIAAASIGQVHRGLLKDGRDVAIKVQYPGIARSIDSDVSNVGALVKLSGLVPRGFDLAPYMDEARKQLHEETDYTLEAAHMVHFQRLLDGSEDFEVPDFFEDWSTHEVLTMSYAGGRPIDTAANASQAERNRIAAALVELTLREVFEFGQTQSDPNFANYLYNTDSGRIALLDFGATRNLDPGVVDGYRLILRAGLAGDNKGLKSAAAEMGLIEGSDRLDDRIISMIRTVFDAVCASEVFDFADRTLTRSLNDQGKALMDAGHVPSSLPMDIPYLQRKFGGMFLLMGRLQAEVPVREMLGRYVHVDP